MASAFIALLLLTSRNFDDLVNIIGLIEFVSYCFVIVLSDKDEQFSIYSVFVLA